MKYPTKNEMFIDGRALVKEFCRMQSVDMPAIQEYTSAEWKFGKVCAYYRNGGIHICVPRCAHVGAGGASWSYPGYVVDRTPYGVLAHELGHFFDVMMGKTPDRYRSDFSGRIRSESGERRLTSYCPDDGEWFAEMFRLFVTNPDLLRLVRPMTYLLLREHFAVAEHLVWSDVLDEAPNRTVNQAQKKIDVAGGA